MAAKSHVPKSTLADTETIGPGMRHMTVLTEDAFHTRCTGKTADLIRNIAERVSALRGYSAQRLSQHSTPSRI
jgi:hypothetical protein